jgi:hypothetical protein
MKMMRWRRINWPRSEVAGFGGGRPDHERFARVQASAQSGDAESS